MCWLSGSAPPGFKTVVSEVKVDFIGRPYDKIDLLKLKVGDEIVARHSRSGPVAVCIIRKLVYGAQVVQMKGKSRAGAITPILIKGFGGGALQGKAAILTPITESPGHRTKVATPLSAPRPRQWSGAQKEKGTSIPSPSSGRTLAQTTTICPNGVTELEVAKDGNTRAGGTDSPSVTKRSVGNAGGCRKKTTPLAVVGAPCGSAAKQKRKQKKTVLDDNVGCSAPFPGYGDPFAKFPSTGAPCGSAAKQKRKQKKTVLDDNVGCSAPFPGYGDPFSKFPSTDYAPLIDEQRLLANAEPLPISVNDYLAALRTEMAGVRESVQKLDISYASLCRGQSEMNISVDNIKKAVKQVVKDQDTCLGLTNELYDVISGRRAVHGPIAENVDKSTHGFDGVANATSLKAVRPQNTSTPMYEAPSDHLFGPLSDMDDSVQSISTQPSNTQPNSNQLNSNQPISKQPNSKQQNSKQPISKQPNSKQQNSKQPISKQPISKSTVAVKIKRKPIRYAQKKPSRKCSPPTGGLSPPSDSLSPPTAGLGPISGKQAGVYGKKIASPPTSLTERTGPDANALKIVRLACNPDGNGAEVGVQDELVMGSAMFVLGMTTPRSTSAPAIMRANDITVVVSKTNPNIINIGGDPMFPAPISLYRTCRMNQVSQMNFCKMLFHVVLLRCRTVTELLAWFANHYWPIHYGKGDTRLLPDTAEFKAVMGQMQMQFSKDFVGVAKMGTAVRHMLRLYTADYKRLMDKKTSIARIIATRGRKGNWRNCKPSPALSAGVVNPRITRSSSSKINPSPADQQTSRPGAVSSMSMSSDDGVSWCGDISDSACEEDPDACTLVQVGDKKLMLRKEWESTTVGERNTDVTDKYGERNVLDGQSTTASSLDIERGFHGLDLSIQPSLGDNSVEIKVVTPSPREDAMALKLKKAAVEHQAAARKAREERKKEIEAICSDLMKEDGLLFGDLFNEAGASVDISRTSSELLRTSSELLKSPISDNGAQDLTDKEFKCRMQGRLQNGRWSTGSADDGYATREMLAAEQHLLAQTCYDNPMGWPKKAKTDVLSQELPDPFEFHSDESNGSGRLQIDLSSQRDTNSEDADVDVLPVSAASDGTSCLLSVSDGPSLLGSSEACLSDAKSGSSLPIRRTGLVDYDVSISSACSNDGDTTLVPSDGECNDSFRSDATESGVAQATRDCSVAESFVLNLSDASNDD